MAQDVRQFRELGNLLAAGSAAKWGGIAAFEYSWFGLLSYNSACFKGRGPWGPVLSRLKQSVSTLPVELSDTELALCHRQCHQLLKPRTGADHSTLNKQNKTRGPKPTNLSYHFSSSWNVVC